MRFIPFPLQKLQRKFCGTSSNKWLRMGVLPVTCKFEKDIQRAILAYLKRLPECFAWKEHGGIYGTAGIPDIICCYKGKFIAFEIKRPTGKLTKIQELTIQRIKDAKGQAYKVTSLEEVKDKLKNLEVNFDENV